MYKRLSMLLALLLIFAILSACATTPPGATSSTTSDEMAADAANNNGEGSGEGTMENGTRGILRMPHPLVWEGKETLDPAGPVSFDYANYLLYNRLVRLDEEGVPMPELATAWEANEDATAWTFTLRDDVTFHDGSPMTSADVAYTFAHILDPATESPAASLLGLIAGTETPDAQTIVFQLSEGHADFPLLLVSRFAAIVPADSAATIAESGIGTGPFKLESLTADGTTVFVANDDYWKGTPGLAGIELVAMADSDSRVLGAQSGQFDLVIDLSATQADLFAGDDTFSVLEFPTGRFATLVMRTDTPPFDDVRVRQAMKLVADRQVLIDLVSGGAGTISCDTPVAPRDVYRWESECPQDIDGAKALLAEAGYPDGLDVTLYTADVQALLIPMAEVYQQQAAAAGINVTLEVLSADSYWSAAWMIEPFLASYWLERPADNILNTLWRSTAPWNEAYFQNTDFDQLLDEARSALDFEARRTRYQEAQQLGAMEGGHLVPFHVNQFTVVSTNVTGVQARSEQHMEWHLISKGE
ncbi:MAG: ABC transporter substrate-binding protein [Caldilineaceae bacterium]